MARADGGNINMDTLLTRAERRLAVYGVTSVGDNPDRFRSKRPLSEISNAAASRFATARQCFPSPKATSEPIEGQRKSPSGAGQTEQTIYRMPLPHAHNSFALSFVASCQVSSIACAGGRCWCYWIFDV